MKKKSVEHSVLRIEQSNVEIIESFTASITGRQDVEIYPQVSGTISHIKVQEGQQVKKGDILFIIDQIPYKADLQTALADKEAVKENVANAVNISIERLNDGKNYIVTNGLNSGDVIVLDGVGMLLDGAEIKVIQKK